MINAYIDPNSYIYLKNALFGEGSVQNRDDSLSLWSYLKKYCFERNILLKTIDAWDENNTNGKDIYVSFEHKNFLKRLYWHVKNKNYPVKLNLSVFKKRILFQFESPFIMPEVYENIDNICALYDEVFFSCKVKNPKVRYMHYWQTYDSILPKYWHKADRKFLTMINSRGMKRSFKKLLFSFVSIGKFPRIKYRELISEREKAVEFFSKNNEIDLYGSGWGKMPSLKKVYKGRVESKYAAQSNYTFSICYENCIFPGYITEKIFDCLYTGTIPIYLGAPDIIEYIPVNCFIDMRDFKDYEELSAFLKSLSEKQIQAYKEQGRNFLESEQYKPFTKEHFAKTFVEACKSNS